MKILVLGGTRFLGRAIVDAALASGHQVALFNRGRTHPDLYPEVERIAGDRTTDLSGLTGRTWDVVVDVAAYDPAVVERSVAQLKSCGHYVFISTLSVYSDQSKPYDESGPLIELRDDMTDEGELYGGRKAKAESIVRAGFENRHTIVRAGLIVGPHDSTDRFAYWPRRLAKGGRALAPGDPSDPLQFIDVRDLGAWSLNAGVKGTPGTFNVTGKMTPIGDFLEVCKQVTSSDAVLEWVSSARLLEAGVDPWMGVPLWIAAPGWEAANCVDISRALAAGLTFRPLEDTVGAAWTSDTDRRQAGEVPELLTYEREQELLARVSQHV